MYRIFIADKENENIKFLSDYLTQKQDVVPEVWQDRHGYQKFLEKSESAVVFARVDNYSIPCLKLTQAAIERGANIHVVWMSGSYAHALDAFRYGAEAYLLLPATEEMLKDIFHSLNRQTKKNKY